MHNSVIIVIIVAAVGVFLGTLLTRSRSRLPTPVYKPPLKPLNAFVLGGTGTTGKAIIRALMDNQHFQRIKIIGRRRIEYEMPGISKDPNFYKIEQKIIDFDEPSTYYDAFRGFDVGFCTLGAKTTAMSKEDYFHITHNYVVESARLAKAGGCTHFHFVSASLASKNSMFHWARTKFQTVDKLSQIGFERLSIYRPQKIIKDLGQVEGLDEVTRVYLYKYLDPFGFIHVDSVMLGQVMVNNTLRVVQGDMEILEHSDIHYLAQN